MGCSAVNPNEGMVVLDVMPHDKEHYMAVSAATTTFYKGEPPTKYLRERVSQILAMNPWLAAEFCKGKIFYPERIDNPNSIVDKYFKEVEEDLTDAEQNYLCMNKQLMPHVTKSAYELSKSPGKDPAFLVVIVRLKNDTERFALVASLNHVLGDGATFYNVYGMLNQDTPVRAIQATRIPGFDEATRTFLGKKEAGIMTSFSLISRWVCNMLGDIFTGRRRELIIAEVDQSWLEAQKAEKKEDCKFVSSNDVLTSLIFGPDMLNVDMALMEVNVRGRDAGVFPVTNDHAGNYTVMLPMFKGDFHTPALIRKALQIQEGTFRVRRAGNTSIPGASTIFSSKYKFGAVTNWATLYNDVKFPNCEQQVHLPMMNLFDMAPFNGSCVWKARKDTLGIFMFSYRRYNRLSEKHSAFGKNFLAFPLKHQSRKSDFENK